VQKARLGDRFDASVSNAGDGSPVLVDGGDQGLVNTSNTTFESLLLTTDGGDFTLNLTGSDDAPSGTSSLPLAAGGTSLGYVTVDHSVADENVDEVVFRFRVSRLRLATAGVSPGEVTLYRYVDGSPTALSTTLVRTTPTASVFEATSPGLSVFAVGAGELVSTPADSDGDGGSADTDRDSDDRESESPTPTPTPMPTPVSSDSDATVTPQATETPASESTTATGGASTAVETSEPETSVADSEGTVTTTVGADAATPTEPEPATTSTTFDGFGALTLLLALFAVLSVVLFGRRRR
jgi:hypothetical protein